MRRHAIIAGSIIAAVMMSATSAEAATRGVTVTLKAGEAPNAASAGSVRLYGASHALVVGIDAYTGGWPRLSKAVADARAVADELARHGFEVTLKTDLAADDLNRTLKEFFVVKGDDPEARLFVWFAGHGHTLGGEGFLVPADAPRPDNGPLFRLKALPMRDFGTYVRLARSKHVMAVFDACFAGTVFDAQRSLPPAAVTRATTLPVRQFLSSGDADQTVSDDGAFRDLFIRALRGEERADANGDGYVTGSELGLYLTDRLTNLTRGRQTPRYGKLRDKDWDRGDFVFLTARGEPAASGAAVTPPAGGASAEVVFWQSIQSSTNPAGFKAYLEQFPGGTFAALARLKLEELGGGGTPGQKVPAPVKTPAAEGPRNLQVAADNVRIRANPNTEAAVVGTLTRGQSVRVTESVNAGGQLWHRVAAEERANVVAPADGRVAKVEVSEGDPVSEGGIVAILVDAETVPRARAAKAEFDQAKAAAEAAVTEAKRARQLYDAGATTAEHTKRATMAVEQARARVGAAQKRLEAAREELGRTRVPAPAAGTVVEVLTQQGALVRAGAPMVVLKTRTVEGYVFGPLLAGPPEGNVPGAAKRQAGKAGLD